MKRRLLSSIAILAILSTFLWWSQRQREPDSRHSKLLPELQRSELQRIELTLPEGPVLLERRASLWLLPAWENLPADQIYTNFLVDQLLNAPSGDVVSHRPEQLETYGLANPARVAVLKDGAGEVLFRIAFGKAQDGYRAIFVRVDEGPVRRVVADLYAALSRPGWIDRIVWRLPASQIQTIRLAGPGVQREITRAGEEWQGGGEIADCFEATALPMLTHLRAGSSKYQMEPRTGDQALHLHVVTAAETLSIHLFPQENYVLGRRDDLAVDYHFAPIFLERLKDCLNPVEGGKPGKDLNP